MKRLVLIFRDPFTWFFFVFLAWSFLWFKESADLFGTYFIHDWLHGHPGFFRGVVGVFIGTIVSWYIRDWYFFFCGRANAKYGSPND